MTWLTEVTELIIRKKIIKGVKQENFLEEERPRLETKRGHFILSPRNVETSKPKQHHFKVWLTMRKKRRFWKFPERTTGSSAKEYYQIGNTALMSKTDDRRAKQEFPCFTYTEPVKLSIKYEKKKKDRFTHARTLKIWCLLFLGSYLGMETRKLEKVQKQNKMKRTDPASSHVSLWRLIIYYASHLITLFNRNSYYSLISRIFFSLTTLIII